MAMRSSFFLVALMVASVCGHGFLQVPPGRASAWRYGFDTPADYNDNECFCGGFNYQYGQNDGKCGLCGDPYDQDPREHEVGGLYGTGTLVATYQQGQIIAVSSNVTANHLGRFEYSICPTDDPAVEATEECLALYPLHEKGNSEWYIPIESHVGLHSHELQLPADLSCTHCVIRWRYVAGNNWGTDPDGTSCTGCGPQEEFRSCADVTITPSVQEGIVDDKKKIEETKEEPDKENEIKNKQLRSKHDEESDESGDEDDSGDED